MFLIKHESGSFLTFQGKTPHVSKAEAYRFTGHTQEGMGRIVAILNTAKRGLYTAVPV